MGQLVTDYDLNQLRLAYPDLELEPLTSQEEQVLLYVLRGLSVVQAASAAGMPPTKAYQISKSESFEVMLTYMREVKLAVAQSEIKITRDTITQMLLGAHAKAATATEEIAAARELGKLHDLYLDAQRKAGIEVNIRADIRSEKQLERLSDHELIELAGEDYSLEPSND